MADEQVTYPPESQMNPYYTGVGRVAMAWAMLETFVNHTIWELANVEQHAGACITAHIGSPAARFRALISLVRLRGGSEEHVKELNSLSTKIDKLARQRNRAVHDPAFRQLEHTPGTFYRLEITADRQLSFGLQPHRLDQMKELEEKIAKATNEYRRLAVRIVSELPAFDRTQFARSGGIDPGLPPDNQ
jgi:hypothetical protein